MLVAQAIHWVVSLLLLGEYKAEFAFLEKIRLSLVPSSLVGKEASSLVSTVSLPCLFSVMKHKDRKKDSNALQRMA